MTTRRGQVKERPILFSASMVRAILEGKKNQTRRVVKGEPYRVFDSSPWERVSSIQQGKSHDARILCPYGVPGDRLWVRETTQMRYLPNFLTGEPTNTECAEYVADSEPVLDPKGFDLAWWYSRNVCPGIHMPRWASRLTLEVTGVRVERVQEISEDDAYAEGISGGDWLGDPVGEFQKLWDSLNAKRGYGWDKNPWVWVVEFRRTSD